MSVRSCRIRCAWLKRRGNLSLVQARRGSVGVVGVSAVVIAIGLAVAGCSSTGRPGGGTPSPSGGTPSVVAQRSGNHIVITVAKGCPGSLGQAGDVANESNGLHRHLLPVGQRPRAGLVCEYRAGQVDGRQATRLIRSARLGAGNAEQLASVIGQISLARPRGTFHCPADFYGADSVIAFSYPGDRTVDLWYATSGCQTLDNGYRRAYQAGNPSFYAAFESAFAATTRR